MRVFFDSWIYPGAHLSSKRRLIIFRYRLDGRCAEHVRGLEDAKDNGIKYGKGNRALLRCQGSPCDSIDRGEPCAKILLTILTSKDGITACSPVLCGSPGCKRAPHDQSA